MLAGVPASAQQQQKPNILVIMGDDIGYWNVSAYNRGMMGYRTPNIDRTRAKLLVVLPIVISIAFMLVADIDTPRHGIVRVSPQNLTSLAEYTCTIVSVAPCGNCPQVGAPSSVRAAIPACT
jgi:hypothetical protein